LHGAVDLRRCDARRFDEPFVTGRSFTAHGMRSMILELGRLVQKRLHYDEARPRRPTGSIAVRA
jgi:hypothetical protein